MMMNYFEQIDYIECQCVNVELRLKTKPVLTIHSAINKNRYR